MADRAELITLTADIASNFVANNRVSTNEVAGLIQSVHGALAGLGTPAEPAPPPRPEPAVSIRKSINPDYLINLFTGKKLKTLKRNLATSHGMTPAQYRSYWGLPDSYPMVAPNYSESRKAMAKAIGLGRKAGTKMIKSVETAAESVVETVSDALSPAKPARAPRRAPAKAAAKASPGAKPRGRKPKAT